MQSSLMSSLSLTASMDAADDVRVLKLKYDASYPAEHHVFFKAHKVKDPCEEKPNLRTLFLANVPPWCDEEAIARIFSTSCGAVDAVHLQANPSSGPPPPEGSRPLKGFRVAYVIFERPSSVHKALERMDLKKARLASNDSKRPIKVGMEKWRAEYNASLVLDTDALSAQVEAGVAAIDAAKEKERRMAEAQAEEEEAEDADGWVTVSRHTSRKPVGGGTAKAQAKVKAREARKRKRKELENFYRHQAKEKKLARLDELKAKFEKDKERQMKMKAERKFRPQ